MHERQSEQETTAEMPPIGKKPRSRGFKITVFLSVGLWVFVILDCFCLINAPQSTDFGPIEIGLRPQDNIKFDSWDSPWGSHTRVDFRHVYLIVNR